MRLYRLTVALVSVAMLMPARLAAQPQAMDLAPVTRMVSVRGLTFPVVDHGNGPVVLLLHGFPDDRHLWRYQVGPLAKAGFRVVAPDLRGLRAQSYSAVVSRALAAAAEGTPDTPAEGGKDDALSS